MSDYIDQIFDRANLPVLRSLLVDGVGDAGDADHRTYRQRLDEGSAPMNRYLQQTHPNPDAQDAAFAEISQALTACQDVYFEIGLRCGARLLHQLLSEEKR